KRCATAHHASALCCAEPILQDGKCARGRPAMIPLRRLADVRAAGDLIWFQGALDRLRPLRHEADPRRRALVSDGSPVYIARSPGRLDVMGARDVVGIVQLCLQRAVREGRGRTPGLRLLIDSTVPAGRGVASSAALEVAAGAAVAASVANDMTATDLAAACQEVENHVVGAPCGIMDQITSACGRRDRLLRLRCQPGTIEGYVEIPAGYRFYGIDSGISHAVSGADYATVRTARFMGYRMIAAAAGLPVQREGGRLRIDDPRWGGYLANLTGPAWSALASRLPAGGAGRRRGAGAGTVRREDHGWRERGHRSRLR